MRRKAFGDMNCSIAQTLEVVGEWWTILIVREAFLGTERFGDFQRRLGIARNILTDRLDKLVAHGVLAREPIAAGGRRMAYRLTRKGQDLLPVLVALMQWGDRWIVGRERAPLRIVERATGQDVRKVAPRSKDGVRLGLKDLAIAPGPGAGPSERDWIERAAPRRPGQEDGPMAVGTDAEDALGTAPRDETGVA